MNKIKLALASATTFLLPFLVSAQLQQQANVAGVPQVTSLQQIITAIENAAALIFSAIAVIMFIIAGILFLTAQGDPDKVQKARGAFMWGIAGVVVGILAFSIIAIVASFIH